MKVEQKKWTVDHGWNNISDNNLGENANLVLAFGNYELIKRQDRFDELRAFYPNANIVSCSSAGEIINDEVHDSAIIVSALYFEKTVLQCIQVDITDVKDSFDAGTHLSADLIKDEIKALLVMASNITFNADHLLTGINFNLSDHVPILGGMASGQGMNDMTLVGLNEPPSNGKVVAIGLSGDHIEIGHSVDYGWSPFGAEKFITRVEDQQLYEVDGKPIYSFYEQYLNGLVDLKEHIISYPIGIKIENQERRMIRSVLKVNQEKKSILYAGNLKVGDNIRMMKTTKTKLINSAGDAAQACIQSLDNKPMDFVLIINCRGRRNVLKDWSKEEIEYVNSKFEENTPLMGFYSQGELSPVNKNEKCHLHNQSIVIAAFREK
ncbi:MAG: FIST C-terminal domain-containing protein [Reichenbachiella sp.]